MDQSTAPTYVGPEEPAAPAAAGLWNRAGLVIFALVAGGAIFVVGSPYFEITPWNDDPLYTGLLAAGLGLVALALHRSGAPAPWSSGSFAMFVAATAMFAMVVGPFNWLVTLDDESYRHALQDKVAQFLAVVPVILGLTLLARQPWGSIYLQRGRVKRWVPLGLGAFVVGTTVITVAALVSGRTAADLAAAAPWILAFAILNALMEELWFRGIFLGPYVAGMGAPLAVLVTSLVFGAAHVGATYVSASEQLLFATLVAALGVALALVMRWGDSLWGAVLVHLTLDLVVVFGLVESI